MKAFKLACLKYRSGKVSHMGKLYERLRLIKIQDDLIQQHLLNLKQIEGAKKSMEKSRDLISEEKMKKYEIKLQEHGIQLNEDPVSIGEKMLESTYTENYGLNMTQAKSDAKSRSSAAH